MILDVIARRKLEKRDNLNFYLVSEIVDLLQNNKKVQNIEIENRKKQGVTFSRKEFMEVGVNNVEKKFVNKKKIQGVCASPGIVKGECKVVLNKNDMHKISEGDIMVAIGTDFDLMDAIQRSCAVITEEGGLLSHASVVCREMGKPCCIGVENATQILKDGTIINLNATNGEIIIK
jgi:phosphohistidine swiveling domain-containing protein